MIVQLPAWLPTQGGFVFSALLLLTLPYWSSGLFKLTDIRGAMEEARQFNLKPAWMAVAATILVQLGGSLMILTGWAAWAGAAVLAVFTVWATLLAHPFWAYADLTSRMRQRAIFLEHLGLVGGLMLAASISELNP